MKSLDKLLLQIPDVIFFPVKSQNYQAIFIFAARDATEAYSLQKTEASLWQEKSNKTHASLIFHIEGTVTIVYMFVLSGELVSKSPGIWK